MKKTTGARIAWPVWGLTVVGALAATVLGFLTATDVVPQNMRGSPMDTIQVVLSLLTPTLGALIVVRQPKNMIGWTFLVAGAAGSLAFLTRNYARFALWVEPPLPGEVLCAWLADFFDAFTFAILGPFLLLLFPTGRPLSSRWRIVVRIAFVGALAMLTVTLLRAGPLENLPIRNNPFGMRAVTAVQPIVDNLIAVSLLAGVVCLVLRFKRSRGTERQQLKLLVFVVAVGAATVPLWVFLLSEQAGGIATGIILFVAVPSAAGLAVLRYRLFDIDRIVGRTVSYTVVTGVLIGAYLVLVAGFQRLLAPVAGTSNVAVAASTLIVAALFVPVRRRVQGVVDRRFNRSRYDAARTVEAFAARLREEVDMHLLAADLRGVVASTVQPAHVGLWLRERE